jgi:hypothetical protein
MGRPNLPSVLALKLFSCAQGSTTLNPALVLLRVRWCLQQLNLAIGDSKSRQAQILNQFGFVSLILVGQGDQVEYVLKFEHGGTPLMQDDGLTVEVSPYSPLVNADDAAATLKKIARYCEWCLAVEKAAHTMTRPPVLEGDLNDPILGDWIGRNAVDYFREWQHVAFDAAAKTAQESDEDFVKDIVRLTGIR